MRRAHGLAGRGERESERFAPKEFREAEVGDFHAALAFEQDVLRFDVAMDDALARAQIAARRKWRHDRERLLRGDRPACEQLAEIHAIDVLHDEVVEAARFAEVVDGDDVWVLELRERSALREKRARKSARARRPAAES